VGRTLVVFDLQFLALDGMDLDLDFLVEEGMPRRSLAAALSASFVASLLSLGGLVPLTLLDRPDLRLDRSVRAGQGVGWL
jgi:hypothetical protein